MAEKKKSLLLSLPVQMCIGLVVGVIVGAFVSADVGTTWFKPLGDLFIRLIRMVVDNENHLVRLITYKDITKVPL